MSDDDRAGDERVSTVSTTSSISTPAKETKERPSGVGFFSSMLDSINRKISEHKQKGTLPAQELEAVQKSLSPDRTEHINQSTTKWGEVLSNFSSMRTSKKCRQLCFEGIPSKLRPDAWKIFLGNDCKMTPALFSIHCAKAEELRRKVLEAKEGEEGKEEGGEVNKERSVALLINDIPRTFPQLKVFHGDEGPLYLPLLEVLSAYASYRPDVGYVQGMSYIAAILLLNYETYDAFLLFANLLNQDFYFSFFNMNVKLMNCHLQCFQTLFAQHLPDLAEHFQELDVEPSMYLYDWFLTIFCRCMPLDAAFRIWDNYFLHGPPFLFRTALAVLLLYKPNLLTADFEHILSLLNHLPPDIPEVCNRPPTLPSLPSFLLTCLFWGCFLSLRARVISFHSVCVCSHSHIPNMSLFFSIRQSCLLASTESISQTNS